LTNYLVYANFSLPSERWLCLLDIFQHKTLTVEQMLGFDKGKLLHSRSITAFPQHHLVDRDFSWVVPVHEVLFFYLVFV